MHRTFAPFATGSFAYGLAAACLLLQPGTARAANTDDELWVEASASTDIAPGTALKLELETRRRAGPNEYIVGAEVNTDISGPLALGGGVEVHDEAGFTEIRPYQQATLAFGAFDFRSRIEERFFDEAEQMALRLRQRARFRTPLAENLRGFVSAELLYQLRDRTQGGPERIDQWRLNAGVTRKIAPSLSATAGYLFQIRPRDGGQTRHTHVSQLSLAYSF